MTKVSVIIPYYQRDVGILRRALTSVLAQEVTAGVQVEVIVVDDGSPLPPEGEFEGLVFAPPFHLNLIKQPNGGVGAARNAGLRAVSADTTYIAFLDSDDIWNAEHMPTAIVALEQGYDFYFCDNTRIGRYESYLSLELLTSSGNSTLLPASRNVFGLSKDVLIDVTVRSFSSQLSTTVIRASIVRGLFFSERLWAAGEDQLFVLEIAAKARKFCFSTHKHVTCGYGVNIFNSRVGWNNPDYIMRLMESMLAFYEFLKFPHLSQEQKVFLKGNIRSSRLLFSFLTVRYFLKVRKAWPQGLCERTKQDPTFWRWYVASVILSVVLYPMGYFK